MGAPSAVRAMILAHIARWRLSAAPFLPQFICFIACAQKGGAKGGSLWMYVYRSRVLGEEEESRGGAKRHHPWVLQLLVAKSMSSAPCTSPCPNDPMTASTRWHDVLSPPPCLRSASTSSRRCWSSCHHAYLHNTHTRADRQHIARCRPGPQHLHSYAQTRASLMLLRPTRTCGGLGRQKRGIRGGDTAGIVLV